MRTLELGKEGSWSVVVSNSGALLYRDLSLPDASSDGGSTCAAGTSSSSSLVDDLVGDEI